MAYSSLIGARVKRKEDPRLITGKGNYVGDLKLPGMHHVAFVRSPYAHARVRGIDAAADVQVDWEPLPAVVDMLKAREDGAPRLFEDVANNIDHVWTRKRGDPDAAFAGAHRVISQRIASQRLSGVPMEGRAVVAAPDAVTGGLTVWSSC